MTPMHMPFSMEDIERASEEWGCNCGPAALAFLMQAPLAAARHAIPGFNEKRFTNPTMMLAGIEFFGASVQNVPILPTSGDPMYEVWNHERPTLVYVQFTGPWASQTQIKIPKLAYMHTHWAVAWVEKNVPLVFDVNAGICGMFTWLDVLHDITCQIDRADGGHRPIKIWRITRRQT